MKERSETERAYRRGYNLGYSAGWRRAWPWHPHAATVPSQAFAELMVAAIALSDAADHLLCGFDDRGTDKRQLAVDTARDAVNQAIENAVVNGLAAGPREERAQAQEEVRRDGAN